MSVIRNGFAYTKFVQVSDRVSMGTDFVFLTTLDLL
jgi:hypothetical protein